MEWSGVIRLWRSSWCFQICIACRCDCCVWCWGSWCCVWYRHHVLQLLRWVSPMAHDHLVIRSVCQIVVKFGASGCMARILLCLLRLQCIALRYITLHSEHSPWKSSYIYLNIFEVVCIKCSWFWGFWTDSVCTPSSASEYLACLRLLCCCCATEILSNTFTWCREGIVQGSCMDQVLLILRLLHRESMFDV